MKAVFDPEKVERELYLLERELSLRETRTILFNLVIFSQKGDDSFIEDGLLPFLLGKRATRILRISLGHTGETSVSVSARCAPDREDKGVCFQEILIENGEDNAGIAPGSWTAFLIRDLPVYVLWRTDLPAVQGDRGESPLFFAREQADKFLLDGELYASLGLSEYLRRVRTYLVGAGTQVTDFAWERLRLLRVFTAQVFDQPSLYSLLPYVTELQVRAPSELSAWYYTSWVASVLGEGARQMKIVRNLGKELAAEYHFRDTPHTLKFQVNREGIGKAVFGDEEGIVKPLKVPTDGEILLQEVDFPIADPVFRQVMKEL
ncbi:MAG: glucose-6-phosphate dehydrogenase assembly protein OpcA [Spirochaetales bacterium]